MEFEAKVLHERLHDIGANLSHAELFAAGPHLRVRKVSSGETLIAAGAKAQPTCIVMDGHFVVRTKVGNKDLDVVRLGVGTLLGEVSFFDGGLATASVIAETDGEVAVLDHESFERLEAEHPRVAMLLHQAFTRTLAKRMRAATERLEHLRLGTTAPPREGLMEAFRSLFGLGLS